MDVEVRTISRERLLHALYEAAELEHNLMCTYLYAAFSLKDGEADGLSPEEAAAVARWRSTIVHVAIEEMGHLAAVWNITSALCGTPRLGRNNFPLDPGYLPASVVVKLAPFDASAIQNWATNFTNPTGGTPLGNSLRTVARAVLTSPMPRKHIIVITDGENTVGPDPAAVLPEVNRAADRKQSSVFVHFIAFNVDAKVFTGVKKQGASVASAADETQLNSQLDFILQNQILLEKPSKTK